MAANAAVAGTKSNGYDEPLFDVIATLVGIPALSANVTAAGLVAGGGVLRGRWDATVGPRTQTQARTAHRMLIAGSVLGGIGLIGTPIALGIVFAQPLPAPPGVETEAPAERRFAAVALVSEASLVAGAGLFAYGLTFRRRTENRLANVRLVPHPRGLSLVGAW